VSATLRVKKPHPVPADTHSPRRSPPLTLISAVKVLSTLGVRVFTGLAPTTL
jgi:hypothetical protein